MKFRLFWPKYVAKNNAQYILSQGVEIQLWPAFLVFWRFHVLGNNFAYIWTHFRQRWKQNTKLPDISRFCIFWQIWLFRVISFKTEICPEKPGREECWEQFGSDLPASIWFKLEKFSCQWQLVIGFPKTLSKKLENITLLF